MLNFAFRKNLCQISPKNSQSLTIQAQSYFSKLKGKNELRYLDRDHKFFKDFRSSYLLDDYEIFKFFRSQSFFEYMNENFRVLPFLFDPKKIIKFREMFNDDKKFQNHIQEWFQHSREERMKLAQGFPLSSTISQKRVSVLRPFIELYLDYLEQTFPKELEISVSLSSKTDLRMPHEWFPQARKMKRKVVYHHGPTNSGKTFSALEDLEKSGTGIYCAPLRLLAWEIHERLESNGVPCNLITGQEKIIRENSDHVSCTIETSSVGMPYDVAVIDEIQMIGDEERGSAWTNALLGLQASTIHLCGEERALSLVRKLCEITGDFLEERRYQRYSRVFVEEKPFQIEDLQEGDCIITFSTKKVHQMKKKINEINEEMENSCAVIYGKLPPETRKDQAKKFNDPFSNFKYLIATNAIGMGVNLKIRRIIFLTLVRRGSNGELVQIDENEIKQIAGRAGRFTETGHVACVKPQDLRVVKRALKRVNEHVRKDISVHGAIEIKTITRTEEGIEIEKEEEFVFSQELETVKEQRESGDEVDFSDNLPESRRINQAAIFPQFQQIESFSKDLELFENTKSKLSDIFQKFISIAQIEGIYFIQKYDDFCYIADMLEKYNLSRKDHYVFSSSPLNLNEKWKKARQALKEFADNFSKFNHVKIPSMFSSSNPLFRQKKYSLNDLESFEEMHHILDLYLWLGHKYPEAFKDIQKAQESKKVICEIIEQILEEIEPLE